MDTRSRFPLLLSTVFLAAVCARVASGGTAPCDLLTKDQGNALIGAGAGAGSPIANTGCSWTSPGPPKVTLTVSYQSEKMFAAAKSSSPPQTTKTSIPGLGDEAIFTGVQNFASLWLRKGTKFLLIRVYGLPVAEAQTKLKTAAANVLPKL